MQSVPTLTTARFTLRQLGEADVAPLFPTFADEDAMRWWSREPFASEAELAGWLLAEDWDGRAWAAVPKEGAEANRAAIGRFVAMPRGPGVAEVGYLVAKHRHGQGVARECLAALLAHLFEAEGHTRVIADTDPDNAASNRVLERLGFTVERRLKGTWRTHIGVRDSLIWGLEAEDWTGAPPVEE